MNEFEDYYYGYMVPSAGYLKYFKLYLYDEGFVIQMPTQGEPEKVPPFEATEPAVSCVTGINEMGRCSGE